jgi:KDO2-lipid IV(A) lauroyltransferase
MSKQLRYRFETALTRGAFAVFGALPLTWASAAGGAILRTVGPFTRVHGVAQANLQLALPQLNAQQRRKVLRDMWENLGRVFCEYAHLNDEALRDRIRLSGVERLEELRAQGRPVIMMSGHLGNWELLPVAAAKSGNPIHLLYRAPNNPGTAEILENVRKPYTLGMHAKGLSSARALLKAVRNHEPIGVLVDQKTNDGIAVPFFGHEAMTLDAMAHFVRQYDAVILPARCRRLQACDFVVEVDAPLQVSADDDVQTITRAMNAQLEDWIAEDPAQWFWVHRRWKE